MRIGDYIKIVNTFEAMKRNTRHSWLSDGRHESVAEHSWRLTLMAYFLKDEFPGADIDKILKMCIFHDIGEAFTGDIPAFVKTAEDEKTEENTVDKFISTLPEEYRTELAALFDEMNRLETTEAKIYKALDKMETLIQHNEADISTWLPLEYEMNLVYGEKEVQFSEYMKELKKAVNEETVRKIEAEKMLAD
ncbi:MAG: HD domain-containing protein [Ruminiclostridium sp.]|nr:HD domain-containing protein [Ruminiclostridium sp.]